MMLSKPKIQTEAEWEEKILGETLRDVIDEDGNLDFDKLSSNGVTLSLEELYTDDEQHN